MKKLLLVFKQFFSGAFSMRDKSITHLENTLKNEENEFLLLCFSDLLGIDLPTKYYVLEILPYLGEDIKSWEHTISNAKSVWEDRCCQLDMDP